jgi:hypothetical protein
MKPLQFFGGIGNENDVTVTIYRYYLVSNGIDVTVTVCGNNDHLCVVLYALKALKMARDGSYANIDLILQTVQ